MPIGAIIQEVELKEIALLLLLVPFLQSCEKPADSKNGNVASPEQKKLQEELLNAKIDSSSPDKLLNSLWELDAKGRRYLCYERETSLKLSKEQVKIIENMSSVYTGLAKEVNDHRRQVSVDSCLGSLAVFDRSIQKVETESPTRAVVVFKVKNVSPIPPNANSDKYAIERREKGEIYKVDFSKAGEEWKIDQVYWHSEYGDEPWSPAYSKADLLPKYPDESPNGLP